MIAVLLRVLAPAPAGGRNASIATIVTFALGAALGCVPLLGLTRPAVALLAAAGLAALGAVVVAGRSVWARAAATAILAAVHLFWIYIVVSLGTLLAWTAPSPVRWLTAVLALVALAGVLAPRARFRLPTALPLGIWIVTCLVGWSRQDGVLRCDDYFAVRASAGSVLVPTTEELERCRPGESLRIGHYPRRLWEAPGGRRLVMTAQRGIERFAPPGRPVPDRFPGTVCDVPIDGTPECFGEGKMHAVVEAPQADALFVVGWAQRFADGRRGVLYVLPRDGPLRPRAEVRFEEGVGDVFYDPDTDTAGLMADEAEVMRPVRVADGAILDPVPAPISPGETHYDQTSGEGVFCFAAGPLRTIDGQAFQSVAFNAHPFSIRPLAASDRYPTAWVSAVWGCDWDPAARRVYIANASLAVLVIVDYDSGEVVRRVPIGFGFRYVTLDRERRLLYLVNFLNGDVVALDADSGAEVARWFGGRFMRHAVITRDRRALLVTSNVGVIRIPLDELDRTRTDPRG